jgi:hypothetical protein
MSSTEALLAVARIYADRKRLKFSTVSSHALRDGKKLLAIEAGKAGITVERLERTMQWFSDNWPIDAPWPEDVPRPSLSEPAEARA